MNDACFPVSDGTLMGPDVLNNRLLLRVHLRDSSHSETFAVNADHFRGEDMQRLVNILCEQMKIPGEEASTYALQISDGVSPDV